MIPTYIIQMESLPVTRNGKLDKNVLPNPKHISYEKYVAPRDETERYISGIFQEILRVNRVGIDDSFFELGGHSLRAIRLVNMLEQKYGTRIPLRKILENSTVRKLSEEVKRDANREQHVPIKKQPEKNYYEMSSAQKRLYVIDQMQEPNITYNIPLMIKFDEKINTKQLYNALTKLTERHELLRTHFEQINNKFIQVVEDRVEIDFSHIEEKSTEILNVYKKFIKPFDLKKAPLMRTMVIETEKNESILLIDIHHIIYDEGSAQILLNDLANFYNGKKLPELNIQYKDYSVWENARDLNEQKQYWLNEFSDEIPLLNLKTDFPRPQYQSYSGKRAITKLSKDIKGLVRGVQVKTGATEYMIVLSTFMLLLNRYSRQEEIVIGSSSSWKDSCRYSRYIRDVRKYIGY
ncbi:condensation domain-containing protein [Bacillus wiedmannii]|uniref:condensation domain-containing protein n=1 Tax=Bacillus wiedmannii TaxID=1890302 RepID=UPI000BF159DE|nr:condensation domain-containing protein [Bacillus wiedmannii]PEJ78942.1 hypothetical protein CN685_04610 [Bacillus wiedmannii]